MTQNELAGRIGKTPESVSNIERGQQTPTLETLAALAAELDMPIAELFADDARPVAASDARLRAEARLREIVRALGDRGLDLVIDQAAAVARHEGGR